MLSVQKVQPTVNGKIITLLGRVRVKLSYYTSVQTIEQTVTDPELHVCNIFNKKSSSLNVTN